MLLHVGLGGERQYLGGDGRVVLRQGEEPQKFEAVVSGGDAPLGGRKHWLARGLGDDPNLVAAHRVKEAARLGDALGADQAHVDFVNDVPDRRVEHDGAWDACLGQGAVGAEAA